MKKITLGLFMLSSMVFSSQAAAPKAAAFKVVVIDGGTSQGIAQVATLTLFGDIDPDLIYTQNMPGVYLGRFISSGNNDKDELKATVNTIVEIAFQTKLKESNNPEFNIESDPAKHAALSFLLMKENDIQDQIVDTLTEAWHPTVTKAIEDASAAKKNAQ